MKGEDIKTLERLAESMRNTAQTPGLFNAPIGASLLINLRSQLANTKIISDDYPSQWQYFIGANKALVTLISGRPYLNPIALGQIIAVLEMVIREEREPGGWKCIHPLIQKSSKQLYLDGHYANAAEDAFIELNDRGKNIYRKLKPSESNIPDGRDLMNKLFGPNGLVKLEDTSTDTGRDIQEGFHFMFAGSIAGLRNPKAHTNAVAISAEEAMRRMMFASMLMYKLDEVNENNAKP